MKENDVTLTHNGIIRIAYPNAEFCVELKNGHVIRSSMSGKMRKRYSKLMIGDSVKVEISSYDLTKGRIVAKCNT